MVHAVWSPANVGQTPLSTRIESFGGSFAFIDRRCVARVASIGQRFAAAIVKRRDRGWRAQEHAVAGSIDCAMDATNGLMRHPHLNGGSRRTRGALAYPEMQVAHLDSGQGARAVRHVCARLV